MLFSGFSMLIKYYIFALNLQLIYIQLIFFIAFSDKSSNTNFPVGKDALLIDCIFFKNAHFNIILFLFISECDLSPFS